MNTLRRWTRVLSGRLQWSLEESARYARYNATLVGLLGTVGYPLYYHIWTELFPQPYENLALRLIGTVLFLPLLLYRFWPSQLKNYFTVYWLAVLLYGLPFFFTYMLLRNDLSLVWSMSTMAALFLLVLVVYDWLMVLLIALTGFVLAWLYYMAVTGEPALTEGYLGQLPIYLFVLIAGNIFNYTANMVKEEKMKAYAAMGRTIAHELRTPLLGIKSAASALDTYLPRVLENSEAVPGGEHAGKGISRKKLDALRESPSIIIDEVNYANTVIDMMLFSAGQGSIDRERFSWHSARETIESALQRYPFRSTNEKRLLHKGDMVDFDYYGPQLLVIHVLFNLLKNALQSVQSSGYGTVTVIAEAGDRTNTITVRDTGPGIAPEAIPGIFEQFSSLKSPDQGTGIGLSFCKLVMESMGGYIRCDSTPGQYTEFTLHFPENNDGT